MALLVPKNEYSISQNQRNIISTRYKTVTKAINSSLWKSTSDTNHSFYVGSYGRGTAIDTSDIDILVEVPSKYYTQSPNSSYNPQSRLLQIVKQAILNSYPNSNIKGDGQVVVIEFSDGIKFEVLPAIPQGSYLGNTTYIYPDSHLGGHWRSTNPKSEQIAMVEKNQSSNGLLFDTCKHFRYVRDNYFSSYHLSGIVIDSFVYVAMQNWSWVDSNKGQSAPLGAYECLLMKYYNDITYTGVKSNILLNAPGSGEAVLLGDNTYCLGRVLQKIAM